MLATPRIRALSAAAAVATALTLGGVGLAYASDDSGPKTCADFAQQGLDAQVGLDVGKLLNLDVELGGAKNGIACDKPADHHAKKKDDTKKDDSDHHAKKKDESDHKDTKKDDKADETDHGQVKVHPKGGVDTGGF